jgi:hypothetical protein
MGALYERLEVGDRMSFNDGELDLFVTDSATGSMFSDITFSSIENILTGVSIVTTSTSGGDVKSNLDNGEYVVTRISPFGITIEKVGGAE